MPYFSLPWSELPEVVRRYFNALSTSPGPGTGLYFTKKMRVDDETLRAEFNVLLANNGGKRMAAMQVLAAKYNYTLRHVRRRLHRKKSD